MDRDADGFLPLKGYAALGDGRAVALSGVDGAIDWWCVPNMDSPPFFDRLLVGTAPLENGARPGHFTISARNTTKITRQYRTDSNVLETRFQTEVGIAVLTESLNSSTAGRLPWAELARRIEVTEGEVTFDIVLQLSHRSGRRSPYMSSTGPHETFHVGPVLGMFLHGDRVTVTARDDDRMDAELTLAVGEREIVAIVAGSNEPLVVPTLDEIDHRIDLSDQEWRDWCHEIRLDTPHRSFLLRQALALKLLLYSPSGAIAAAATTSLPERIGGDKNYDYRFAWVRDAGYIIASFLRLGIKAESKAALTWLLDQLCAHGTRVCFALEGGVVEEMEEIPVPGYRNSRPVLRGNRAAGQHQHGVYGDIFETVSVFTQAGNLIDPRSAETLSHLADECADRWKEKDSGIWELPDLQHYTMSKISCWQALNRAVQLADAGQLPTTCRDRWSRERDRIAQWIDANCWDEDLGAYVMHPGTKKLDAALILSVRFEYDGRARLEKTLDAIDHQLGAGGHLHYRYTGMDREEGCFLACSFWMVEARSLLGQHDRARALMNNLRKTVDAMPGIMPEMIDPDSGEWLGNMPQGLSHLAALQATLTLMKTPEGVCS